MMMRRCRSSSARRVRLSVHDACRSMITWPSNLSSSVPARIRRPCGNLSSRPGHPAAAESSLIKRSASRPQSDQVTSMKQYEDRFFPPVLFVLSPLSCFRDASSLLSSTASNARVANTRPLKPRKFQRQNFSQITPSDASAAAFSTSVYLLHPLFACDARFSLVRRRLRILYL
jgi:hypothetical protein